MVDIRKVIENNDQAIRLREDALVDRVNRAYDRAIAAAIKEFKGLESISENKKVSSQEVKRILDKTLKAFRSEFEVLVSPIQKATLESYEEGLRETSEIVAELKTGKEE